MASRGCMFAFPSWTLKYFSMEPLTDPKSGENAENTEEARVNKGLTTESDDEQGITKGFCPVSYECQQDMANESTKRRFSSLLTVICRTAKRSANRVARIRKSKPVVEEPRKISARNESSTIQPDNGYENTALDQVEQRFNETYELLHLVGRGGFAMVYSGVRVRDSKPVAIKVIPKNNVYSFEEIDGVSVPMEVYLQRYLDHPNIIKLYDYFEYHQAYVLILERPTHYRDLFDFITEHKRLAEPNAKDIFKQVVSAAIYCESKGIFHRDIKDENILLDTKTGQVKLFDFGSGTILENTLYTDYEGTRAYCPPEWFRFHRYYARSATVWSLGVLLYNILMGDVPFTNEIEIVRAELNFTDDVSKDAQDLTRRLLAKHPSNRPTLEDVLQHPWLQEAKQRPRSSQEGRPSQYDSKFYNNGKRANDLSKGHDSQ
ncbi:serine/threonine-protein kinase pim-1-like [Actinia tenebrosa]|uniref:Serine/threonine-protein kinase 1 n=1 Tax=Actinia tenebrosa TaxID=6105 RepID=A0A6P8J291_ACTTE|nr:serine/threonine-protein kinase pim-1-like [Actinia tenebrosa]